MSDLLADLLGATLVDAQEELLVAASTVARAGTRHRPGAGLADRAAPLAAGIGQKLQSRGGESALAMVQDLAGQIAPDPEPRFWLVQSWLRPARPIDHAMLTELRKPPVAAWCAASVSRLARGEWTAWARQRYRRVARLVAGAGSATGATPPRSPLPRDRS